MPDAKNTPNGQEGCWWVTVSAPVAFLSHLPHHSDAEHAESAGPGNSGTIPLSSLSSFQRPPGNSPPPAPRAPARRSRRPWAAAGAAQTCEHDQGHRHRCLGPLGSLSTSCFRVQKASGGQRGEGAPTLQLTLPRTQLPCKAGGPTPHPRPQAGLQVSRWARPAHKGATGAGPTPGPRAPQERHRHSATEQTGSWLKRGDKNRLSSAAGGILGPQGLAGCRCELLATASRPWRGKRPPRGPGRWRPCRPDPLSSASCCGDPRGPEPQVAGGLGGGGPWTRPAPLNTHPPLFSVLPPPPFQETEIFRKQRCR